MYGCVGTCSGVIGWWSSPLVEGAWTLEGSKVFLNLVMMVCFWPCMSARTASWVWPYVTLRGAWKL